MAALMQRQRQKQQPKQQQQQKEEPNPNEEAVIQCDTTKGEITIHLFREWSPHGYDRAVKLFDEGFYDDSHFFRVVPNFLVQFGISYTDSEELKELGHHHTIPDDKQLNPPIPFTTGIISYAGSGPNSRTSQLFITYAKEASSLGTESWETPIGRIETGMDVVESFYSGYGDMPPWGHGPIQGKILHGPEYIEKEFPKLDRFRSCLVFRGASRPGVVNRKEDDSRQNEKQRDHIRLHDHEPGHSSGKIALSIREFQGDQATSQQSLLLFGAALVVLAIVLTWIRFVMKSKKNSKTS